MWPLNVFAILFFYAYTEIVLLLMNRVFCLTLNSPEVYCFLYVCFQCLFFIFQNVPSFIPFIYLFKFLDKWGLKTQNKQIKLRLSPFSC